MRIGIDARELCGHPTGVGRYLGGLLSAWSGCDAARRHEFVLYAPEEVPLTLDTRRFATRLIPAAGATRWEQLRLPAVAARDHLDVFFAPAYSAPLRLRVPIVVAIHDVSFAAHPEWFRLAEGARRRFFSRQSARKAQVIVTISEFSKREIGEHLDVPAGKIRVIPPGVTRLPGAGSTREPSVLFVGSIFNRRHVPDLIRAFAPIARRHAAAVSKSSATTGASRMRISGALPRRNTSNVRSDGIDTSRTRFCSGSMSAQVRSRSSPNTKGSG